MHMNILTILLLTSFRSQAFIHTIIHNGARSYRIHSIIRQTYYSTSLQAVSPIEKSSQGRSKLDIDKEIASGRVLDNGPVIDFGSVKDVESRAERALRSARENYLTHVQREKNQAMIVPQSGSRTRLMGINDEVVAEVGREIGSFVTDDETIQQCAAYLRSKAPVGLFQSHPDAVTRYNNKDMENQAALNELLSKAYEESGLVTEAFAKTFYLGTQLLSDEPRKAIWAVYVWCRRTDEIVDAPRNPGDVDMLTDLSAWEIRLENLFQYGLVEDVLDLVLLDCKIKYPKLPIEPFLDMIRGMLMDIPDLGQDRYESFEQLHLYCYRVAGTVGLMSMPIFGCASEFTEEEAKEPALSLGVAFQLTNILRDVGEDAVKRSRVYLPRQDMERFGVTEEQIFAQRLDSNYVELMKYEIERARMYYERAKRGVFMLAPESRLPVQISLDSYGKILNKIEENGYDSLNFRAYVSKCEKFAEIPFSWYRTLDVAREFPLPGEKPAPSIEELKRRL